MAVRRWNQSIVSRIKGMGWRIVLLLIIPVVVSLTLMLVFSGRYSGSLERMGEIAVLKPVIGDEIPGAVWQVVSGRKTLDESNVYGMIDQVNAAVERITARTGREDRLELIIARRTMDTLTHYVNVIRDNLSKNERVVVNEKVLAEIREVAELVVSMLNDYITGEISASAAMSARLNRIVMYTAAAEVLLVLLTLLLANRMARSTARFVRAPIEQLESVTARIAEGDMRARLPVSNVDEMRNLTGQVNIMADNLDTMMQQRILDERNLKKSELRTLQAQINPHFLYNTLDAIVWQAEAKNTGEVIHITRALSDFFRISLNSGGEWITVAQEKQHLEGYLSIQKVRYRDILEYTVEIDPQIEDKIMLKLLLQPLVENALYHGVKKKRGVGMIRVTGRRDGDGLYFCVEDNGGGMTPERLSQIRAALKDDRVQVNSEAEGGSGFGLKNVDLRIRLYYSQNEGLSVESDSSGTRVSFRLPAEMKGKNDHV